mmetsp:Transcript_4332/g.12739  ORF Transcript_4332/g.12739 Transcript_4332/m.12739 type:complete len:387 (+) Transcript_4332:1399-2559(+)
MERVHHDLQVALRHELQELFVLGGFKEKPGLKDAHGKHRLLLPRGVQQGPEPRALPHALHDVFHEEGAGLRQMLVVVRVRGLGLVSALYGILKLRNRAHLVLQLQARLLEFGGQPKMVEPIYAVENHGKHLRVLVDAVQELVVVHGKGSVIKGRAIYDSGAEDGFVWYTHVKLDVFQLVHVHRLLEVGKRSTKPGGVHVVVQLIRVQKHLSERGLWQHSRQLVVQQERPDQPQQNVIKGRQNRVVTQSSWLDVPQRAPVLLQNRPQEALEHVLGMLQDAQDELHLVRLHPRDGILQSCARLLHPLLVDLGVLSPVPPNMRQQNREVVRIRLLLHQKPFQGLHKALAGEDHLAHPLVLQQHNPKLEIEQIPLPRATRILGIHIYTKV